MDSNDQDDIIKKVKSAGNNDNQDDSSDDNAGGSDFGGDMGGDQGVSEGKSQVEIDNPTLYPDGWKEMDGMFLANPKKNNMFQPGSNDKLKENLKESKKNSIFVKNNIKLKLKETFNQDDMDDSSAEPMVKPEPTTKPKIAPTTKPNTAPSRKNKPFLPMPHPDIKPDPKAKG